MGPRFLGLSTGRAGSRYLAELLNKAGVRTLHEVHSDLRGWCSNGALGEVSAHFVTQMALQPEAQVWHFSRHPQPFVASLMAFGFWGMHAPHIHPFLRRTGNPVADSFRYWVDWNQKILDAAPEPQRTTFRIEDIDRNLVVRLAAMAGIEVNGAQIEPVWDEKQEFSEIPAAVEPEVFDMMETLGYARGC